MMNDDYLVDFGGQDYPPRVRRTYRLSIFPPADLTERFPGSAADFDDEAHSRVLAAIPYTGIALAMALLATPAAADHELRLAQRCGELHDPYAKATPAKAILQSRLDLLRQIHAQDVELAEARARLAEVEGRLKSLEASVASLLAGPVPAS
jgi:septal ring factor EnvC (AmiA/AmiB activator)